MDEEVGEKRLSHMYEHLQQLIKNLTAFPTLQEALDAGDATDPTLTCFTRCSS